MARIKHIAIRTSDPRKTENFYKDVFGLKELPASTISVTVAFFY